MQRDSIQRLMPARFRSAGLYLLVALFLLIQSLSALGCEQRVSGLDEGNAETEEEDDSEEEDHQPTPDEEGHGPDPDQEGIDPGFMNGSWRVATNEQDTPAVYFDTFHDEGESEVTGTYLMAIALVELYDGESGDIETGQFDGESLTIEWNPTTDSREMYILEADRVDQDTLEGRVTAEQNPEIDEPVVVTRRQVD